MRIGQIVKNTLDEFRQQQWQKKVVWDDPFLAIRATVLPEYARAVEILIESGLEVLKREGRIGHVGLDLKNHIFLDLIAPFNGQEAAVVAPNFFNELERAISNFVQKLELGWAKTETTLDELEIPEKDIQFYDDSSVILALPTIITPSKLAKSNVLLRFLAEQYDSDATELYITHKRRKRERENETFTPYLVGKKEMVEKFIHRISENLSPSNFCSIPSKVKSTEPTLKESCLQAISRHSLFQPAFSLDRLQNSRLPERILSEIEEQQMESITSAIDMDKYKGKIIIFKTNAHHLSCKNYHLLYPARKALIVGIVSSYLFPRSFSSMDLLTTDGVHTWTHALITSKLKYSNFKCRLPNPAELDMIQEIVHRQKIKWFGFRISTEVIDSQRAEGVTHAIMS